MPSAIAGYVHRASTSPNVRNDATSETYPSKGQHLFVLVADGTDVRRFLYALHDRCWLAGLSWYIVGMAGQLLERSILDRSVFGAERLVFEASPDLEPPFTQGRREAVVHDGEPRSPSILRFSANHAAKPMRHSLSSSA